LPKSKHLSRVNFLALQSPPWIRPPLGLRPRPAILALPGFFSVLLSVLTLPTRRSPASSTLQPYGDRHACPAELVPHAYIRVSRVVSGTHRCQLGLAGAHALRLPQCARPSLAGIFLCWRHAAQWNGSHGFHGAGAHRRFGPVPPPCSGLLLFAFSAHPFDLSVHASAPNPPAKLSRPLAGPSCYLEQTEMKSLRPCMNLKTNRCRILFLANFLLLPLGGRLNAQARPRSSPQPESTIQQIKKSVVFIVGNEIVDGALRSTAGTGFLVFVPEPRLGDNRGVVWLVTCDHVIRSPEPDGNPGPYYKAVSVRYNTRVPGSSGARQFDWLQMPVLDGNGKLLWFRDPDDPSSDVAAYPININPEIADI
jgi:hypothetical protein